MRTVIRKTMAFIMSILMVVSVAGCGKDEEEESESRQGMSDNEIITTTPVDQDKTMITIRVEFGAGQQENLEEVLEKQFPNVDIVLRHDGSTDSVYTMRADLEAGVECDFIMSRRLPAIADVADKYLYDLSSELFVDNYYINAVDSCATSDGKLYYLPGPSDVYGIVYDKTMFEENGWKVPHSYTEFVSLLDTIRDTGINPLAASLMYPDMFQILFNLYGYEDVYAGSDNFTWLTQYQNGEGSMVGHMEKAVENFRKLFDDGVLSLDSLELSPSERSEMLYKDHSTAMIIECQNAVTYSQAITEDSEENMHEYAMMPFWTSDEKNGDFLYTIPSYYMAINKKSAEESEEKKEILLKIYRYLSSVEGQKTLIGDNFQLSNILGVTMNSNDFSEGIISTIERGQAINTFYLAAGETNKQVERQMLSTVGDMVQGKISVEDWLLGADEVRDKYLAGELDETEVLGSSKSTLTRLQTAYTVADMYRTLMDVPIGICFGGAWEKSTNGYLYKGDITAASLACIEPDKEVQADSDEEVDDRIVTSYLTGQQIIDILNSGDVEIETKGLYPYYVAAGLEVEFNPWAKEGNRVISCKLPDGENLDLNELYEVAYFNGSLPDDMDAELEDILPMTWQEAFVKWLNDNDGVVEKPDMTITLSYE